MKTLPTRSGLGQLFLPLFVAFLCGAPTLLRAAAPEIIPTVEPLAADWHAKSIGGALGLTALFGLVGVVLAFVGYKFFDTCTPGDMHKEIFENKNVAVAIVAAAVILGVCCIIAAAIMG